MTALINLPRAAWKRQPPGPVQVNAANGLTQGLISLYHAPTDRDLVLNRQAFGYKATPLYFESRGVKSVTDRGVAAPANAALATAVNGFPGLKPSAVTLLQMQRFASGGTYSTAAHAGWANGGYNLGVRYSSANFFPFAGVGLEQAVSLKDDRWHWLGVSNNSTGQAIAWKDGRAVVTNNSAAAVSYSGLTSGYDAFYVNIKVPCVLSAVWNRALSAEEHAELYNHPWQLFQPAPSRFYLIPSSGGASSYTSTFSLDAFIQNSFSQTTTLDALLQTTFNSTISLDSLISAVRYSTISLDAVLQVAGGISVSVDALLQATKAGTLSIDALIQATLLKTLSLDALVQKSSIKVVSFDALIQSVKSGSVSLDAYVALVGAKTVSLDALIQAIHNKTLSVDALIQDTYTSTFALDAYVALVGAKTVSLDALLQMTKTGSVSLDALVEVTKMQFVSFDVLIQAAKTGTISLDAILTLAKVASVSLDAFIQKSLVVGVSLDAIIGVLADMILPTGRVVRASASDRLTVIPPTDRFISSLSTD